MVSVHKAHIARLYIRLQDTVACGTPFIYFLCILKDTGSFIAPEITDRLAIFCTVEFAGIVVQLIACTMDDTIAGRNVTYLILVVGTVQ